MPVVGEALSLGLVQVYTCANPHTPVPASFWIFISSAMATMLSAHLTAGSLFQSLNSLRSLRTFAMMWLKIEHACLAVTYSLLT